MICLPFPKRPSEKLKSIKVNSLVNHSIAPFTHPSHSHMPHQQDTNPPNTTASRLRPGYHGPARSPLPSCPQPPPLPLHPPVPARRRPRPWVLALEAATAIPLWQAPAPSSTGVAAPPPAAGSQGGGRPSPKSSPVDTSYPFQNLCSSSSWSLQGIRSSRRGGIFSTRYPPYLRRSQDFLSASRAWRRMSISSE